MSEADLRATRRHKILDVRQQQLRLNLMVKDGGAPYINERLSKFHCESNASWLGDGTGAGGVLSRPDRSFLINYAGRIVTKNNQYVFGQDILRPGIDHDFEQDATRTGLTINQFMQEVSAHFTAGQWAWIGVDRGTPGTDPDTGKPAVRSVKAAEDAGDKIFWSLWNSTEVVDWRFGSDGALLWLITQEALYENEDPKVAAVESIVRTLWERGGGTRLFLDPDNLEKILKEEPFTISAKIVPFTPLGVPTPKPYWFDDVERVQASLLNLESAHHENLIQTVFPQMVLPADLIENVMRLSGRSYDEALELVRGIEYPMLETIKSAGMTRYLIPSAGDLKAIPDEILRRRKELYEIVGLAMTKTDSNSGQSAASKAWDHLDPAATLRTRSIILEDTETAAIKISMALDSTFKEYIPLYPRQFNLVDVAEAMKTLVELSALDLPRSAVRESMRIGIKIMDSIQKIPDERMEEMMKEIDDMADDEVDRISAAPAAQVINGNLPEDDDAAAFNADE